MTTQQTEQKRAAGIRLAENTRRLADSVARERKEQERREKTLRGYVLYRAWERLRDAMVAQ